VERNDALGYEFARKAVERFANGDPNLCWGSMIYACRGTAQRPPCGHGERYWMGVGVEGPASLREALNEVFARDPIPVPGWDERWADYARARYEAAGIAIIPSPFIAGQCPKCGGQMQHVRWNEDEQWWPALRLAPAGTRYFRVPSSAQAAEYARTGYGGAELVTAWEPQA
jgi:hypothetical protein